MIKKPVFWILLLALVLRIFVCISSHTINPDGKSYIYQAMAAYHGQYAEMTGCRLRFVTIQPFLIAAAYAVVGDWVAAGLSVSVLFSFASLLCLYALSRQFFDEKISCLLLLVYSMIPMFVKRSAEVLRDPVFWFFTAAGMLAFNAIYQNKRFGFNGFLSMLSGLLFVIATSLRIEGALFLAFSPIFLLLSYPVGRVRQLFFFCLPAVTLATALIVFAAVTDHHLLGKTKFAQIQREATGLLSKYASLEQSVQSVELQANGIEKEFFNRLRQVLWVVPVGLIANSIGEGFFYPYVLIYLFGFVGFRTTIRDDPRIRYFFWLSVLSLVIVYVHLLRTWFISTRFLAIFMLPGFVFVGYGLKHILSFIRTRRKMRETAAIVCVAVYILVFGLSKNIRQHYTERIPYRQAGEIIESQRGADSIERIMAVRTKAAKYTFFYAHRHSTLPVCDQENLVRIPASYSQLVETMDSSGIRYLLYERRRWRPPAFDFLSSPYLEDFEVLGRWDNRDTGLFMLLKRRTAH